MNSLRLRRALRALGWPGLIGLLALLLAAALWLAAARWDEQAALSQAQADRLRQELRLKRAAGAQEAQAPATQAQWWQALPPAAERQQRLADLLEMGLRLGLVSARTEHRLSVDAAAGLERLRVSMPVTGGYAQVRQFIAAALQHDAALSLDGLKLRRASPQAAEVEAELQWSLHSRADAKALEQDGAKP
ncbi:hypothetical protein DBR47_08660 [Paucibacter sp. KBW04]|uniref:hypothetical protein n=1 Tax=Paucibacter sp. KBW04 TaxID=2153361 RepID=UPI000F5760B2|nr:hypothetical protein [Paucibacter sp. KBW04]RQO60424.1 hypothetical protein DBR47_08660 [Paucibacter sp. KBW04]